LAATGYLQAADFNRDESNDIGDLLLLSVCLLCGHFQYPARWRSAKRPSDAGKYCMRKLLTEILRTLLQESGTRTYPTQKQSSCGRNSLSLSSAKHGTAERPPSEEFILLDSCKRSNEVYPPLMGGRTATVSPSDRGVSREAYCSLTAKRQIWMRVSRRESDALSWARRICRVAPCSVMRRISSPTKSR